MKRKGLAMLLVAALMLMMAPQGISQAADAQYSGFTGGDSVIKGAAFKDILKNTNRDNIMKMAIYAIIREYGNTNYRPTANALRQDLLASLVRAMGLQQQAVAQAETLKQQDPLLDQVSAYMRGHVDIARNNNLITPAEITALSTLTKADQTAVDKEVAALVKQNWKMTQQQRAALKQARATQKGYDKVYKSPVTREEAALWIARALNLQPVAGEKTMKVYSYKDWKQMKPENIPYIEAVLRKDLMKGAASDRFNPKGTISRGEMASILNNVANENLGTLGYSTGYGRVTGKKVTKNPGSFNDIAATDITVETPEKDNILINVSNKSGDNLIPNQGRQAVPVIKGGRVGNEALIAKGDIVEYTLDKDNQVVLLQVGSLKEIDGTFNGYDPATATVKLTDKNGSYKLKVRPSSYILAQGIPVAIGGIQKDTPIKAVFGNGILKSMDAKVDPARINNLETVGKIVFSDSEGKILKIKDSTGNMQYLDIADGAKVFINGQQQTLDNLKYDQDAILKLADNKVIEINVVADMPEEEPTQNIITGRIRNVQGNNLFISTDTDPSKQVSYNLDSNTIILKDGASQVLGKLRQGDRFKAYTTGGSTYIRKLELQGSGVNVANVYKADLKDVSPNTNEVILSNVYTYGFNSWVKKGDYLKLKLSDDAALYKDSTKIDIAKLKDYVGNTLYGASKNNYGEEQLVQAITKEGYEDSLYKTISDIKWTTSQMALSDQRLVGFKDGTIVIKDGRLLDTADLTANTGAFIIQNKTTGGFSSAPVISLDSFNGFSQFRISKGYLHNMGEDYFTLENGYRLANNTWDKWGEFTFQLSNDTVIYDNAITNSYITADKFAESRYKPYTYTWPNYTNYNYSRDYHEDDSYHSDYTHYKNSSYYHEHCLLYTISDENGMTKAINIYLKDKEEFNPDAVNLERMSSGKIDTLNTTNKILTVKEAMDYSPVYEKWQPVSTAMPFDLTKAVILKNDTRVDFSSLNSGDSIYVFSVNGDAIFAFIE